MLRHQLGNHLGSACLETTDSGEVLTREEYYPYGGTAYAFAASGAAGFSVKRYRYAGKECDSENGLYYFGARYFAAWLGRWTAGDPVFAAGKSPFEYCHSNPTTKVDPDGRWPREYHEELAVRRPEAFAAQGRIGAPAALTAIGIAVSAVGVGYAFAAFGPAAGAVALADEAFGQATGIPISPSSAVRIARNPIKAVEQTVEAARAVAAAVRGAGSGVHVAEKIAVASESAGTAARRATSGAELGLRPGLPKVGGGIDSGAEAASALKGGRKQLPSGRPGTVVLNRLLPHEAAFAQEIVDFQEGTFVGAVEKSLPEIDGHLSGIPVSLKETAGGLGAVLRHASKAETSALSAGVSGVELFIKAPNVRATQLLDFARGGPLSQIPGQGTISGISVFTQDGVVRLIGAQIARGAQ